MRKIVIAGAGGHARSVISALRSLPGQFEPVACVDPAPAIHGGQVDGVPVLGDDTVLPRLLADGVATACVGVGGTGDNRRRAAVYGHLRDLGFALPAIVHAAASVAPSARLGDGTQVLAGAIVGAGAEVGEDVIVNTGAIVEHDGRVGAHAHLATGCALGGSVSVGALAHIGLGAAVLQGISIGEEALVGAGAVVIRDVGPFQLAIGCPASARARTG